MCVHACLRHTGREKNKAIKKAVEGYAVGRWRFRIGTKELKPPSADLYRYMELCAAGWDGRTAALS